MRRSFESLIPKVEGIWREFQITWKLFTGRIWREFEKIYKLSLSLLSAQIKEIQNP